MLWYSVSSKIEVCDIDNTAAFILQSKGILTDAEVFPFEAKLILLGTKVLTLDSEVRFHFHHSWPKCGFEA